MSGKCELTTLLVTPLAKCHTVAVGEPLLSSTPNWPLRLVQHSHRTELVGNAKCVGHTAVQLPGAGLSQQDQLVREEPTKFRGGRLLGPRPEARISEGVAYSILLSSSGAGCIIVPQCLRAAVTTP